MRAPIALLGGVVLALTALGHTAPSAVAQGWPQRAVRFILPLGPGAGVDIGARLLADRLTKRWGQPVVVENRPGADGVIAITAVIGARDDHTLFFGPSSSFVAHPYLHEKLPYDQRDLLPIARVSNTIVTVSVPPSLGVATLKELMDRVKAEPGKLNWTTITGVTDFLVAGFLKEAGLEMAKVPYRDTVQALNDLAEGRIHLYIAAYAIVRSQAQAGRIRIVAVTNHKRASMLPDLPTVAEAGFPALEFDGLAGFFGPPGMSEDLRNRIAEDVRSVIDAEVISRLAATGQVPSPGGPAEFAAEIAQQAGKVAAFAKTLGIERKNP